MYINGFFKDINDDNIEVTITDGVLDSTSGIYEIDGDDKDILFGESPIEIETNNEDTFQTIIKKTCTINLLTKVNLFELLYADNARDIKVIIRKYKPNNSTTDITDEILFYGYLEPNVYSQPYANYYDELSLTASDYLSTLQYYNYKNADTNYSYYKERANTRTFKDYLIEILNLSDSSQGISKIYYDNSVKLDETDTDIVFGKTGVSDIVFLGDDESDLWSNEDVLNEILQYFNLHIIQIGIDFYIFHYSSITKIDRLNTIHFVNIKDESERKSVLNYMNYAITENSYTDSGTNISVSEVYNQLQVKCNIDGIENLIESPLDSDSLSSFYANKQRYCREYICKYNANAQVATTYFYYLIKNGISVYDGATLRDWYMQAKYNPNWKFWYNGKDLSKDSEYHRMLNGVYSYQTQTTANLHGFASNCICANIVSLGSVELNTDGSDDSVVNTVDMKDYIIISVQGNGIDTEAESDPSEEKLQKNIPIISYESNGSGSLYSPTDDTTINYIVFSGNMLLTSYSAKYVTCDMKELYDDHYGTTSAPINDVDKFVNNYKGSMIPYKDGYRYYFRYFPAHLQSDDTSSYGYYNDSLAPPSEDYSQELEYQKSLYVTDNISKLGILECQLMIGDKYLCETYDDNGNSVYSWHTVNDLPTIDGVKVDSFSIGINPKIGDYIIGTDFEIANNISINMNLGDYKGMAVPIKKSDNLTGAVSFKILGTINETWEEKIMTRHRTWFRRAKYSNVAKSVLAHTNAIFIENFKVQIVSDNDGFNTDSDNDLIYLSAETNKYIDKKDDIEFKIYTALTSEEAYNLGVKSGINTNTVIRTDKNEALTGLYNVKTKETGKAEELYINDNYEICNKPKLLIETQIKSSSATSMFYNYVFTYLNKKFTILSRKDDLKMCSSEIIFKEI